METNRGPPKLTKYLVKLSTSKSDSGDALIAFEERYTEITEEFGQVYADLFAWKQVIKSLPFGGLVRLLKLIDVIRRFAE